jgi:hypothetical protein
VRHVFHQIEPPLFRETAIAAPSQDRRGRDQPDVPESLPELAEELQRSLLPRLPARLPGVELAFRYLPGNDVLQIGGDWFDAVALSGKCVGLVVGDVMGHGVASAAIMGQLRTAVQTLACLGLPPGEVLWHLDEAARRLSDTHLATCLYGVYDPVARTLSLGNAGHVPPVLARPGKHGEVLEVPAGIPVGIGGHGFGTTEVPIGDGDTLVLYTDGLVEVPGHDIEEGIEALCGALPVTEATPEEFCEAIVAASGSGKRSDDVALLVARFHGIPDDRAVSWALEPVPLAARQARRLTRRTLATWGLSGLTDVAELLVSELVGNSVEFASRPIRLRLLYTDTFTCEVRDDGHTLPLLRTVDADSESGRGLSLVNMLALRWGANRTEQGKMVWFELPLGEPDTGDRPGGGGRRG